MDVTAGRYIVYMRCSAALVSEVSKVSQRPSHPIQRLGPQGVRETGRCYIAADATMPIAQRTWSRPENPGTRGNRERYRTHKLTGGGGFFGRIAETWSIMVHSKDDTAGQ